jgi:predicted nuclease with TOPRIM domain
MARAEHVQERKQTLLEERACLDAEKSALDQQLDQLEQAHAAFRREHPARQLIDQLTSLQTRCQQLQRQQAGLYLAIRFGDVKYVIRCVLSKWIH